MIVAIDPGIKGAAAALGPRGFLDVIDLPIIKAGARSEIDTHKFLSWLNMVKPVRIVMENVHSFPKQGVASMFYFGVAVGMLKAICRHRVGLKELELVQPEVWKAYFRLTGSDKEAARKMALHLFPEEAGKLSRKLDHNRAEAMLIAWWAVKPPVGLSW